MALPYSYATLAQAQTELSLRLFDPTFQFWSQAELTLYIQESLRTFNALTSYWRGDFVFPTVENQVFYDLTNPGPSPNPSLRPVSVTDQQLYTIMEYMLLEPVLTNFPAVGSTWTGSNQFSLADFFNSVQRRRDEILTLTGCTLLVDTVAAVPGRTLLSDSILDIRRSAFIPASGLGSASPLWIDDTWAAQVYEAGYTTAPQGTPNVMMISAQPPLSFDVDIQPNVPGTYELLTIQAGGALSVNSASTLSMPDDWTWVLKWGALCDLFSYESNAKDELRAQYCQKRYEQGVKLMKDASALLALRLNNVPLQIDAVHSADAFNPGWEGQAAAQPNIGLTVGLNLIALTPTPDTGPYSVTAIVVQNAPVPQNASDNVQVGRDSYDAVIGYAQHLASFKMGGQELMATVPFYEQFLSMCSDYNSKLAEQGQFVKSLYDVSRIQKELNPERLPPE